MKITNLDKEKVEKEAKEAFQGKYVEMDTTDLFLADMESGTLRLDGMDHAIYVSTHYAYEDHLVNNNKTRYKIPLTLVLLKNDPYDVIYDSKGCCYVAYEEENHIHFVLYEEFQDFLKPYLHVV